MKRSLLLSLPILIPGVLLTVVTLWLLPVCPITPNTPVMRCHWSGNMLAAFGVVFVASGLLLVLCKNSGVRLGISLATLLWAITGALTPTYLIGLCMRPTMQCRTGTYPGVMIVLALIILGAIFNIIYLRRSGTEE